MGLAKDLATHLGRLHILLVGTSFAVLVGELLPLPVSTTKGLEEIRKLEAIVEWFHSEDPITQIKLSMESRFHTEYFLPALQSALVQFRQPTLTGAIDREYHGAGDGGGCLRLEWPSNPRRTDTLRTLRRAWDDGLEGVVIGEIAKIEGDDWQENLRRLPNQIRGCGGSGGTLTVSVQVLERWQDTYLDKPDIKITGTAKKQTVRHWPYACTVARESCTDDSFGYNFPSLVSRLEERGQGDLTLRELRSSIERERTIPILNFAIEAPDLPFVGGVVLLAFQLWFLIHYFSWRRLPEDREQCSSWIGCFPGRVSRCATFTTVALLPFGAAAKLASRVSWPPTGSPSELIWWSWMPLVLSMAAAVWTVCELRQPISRRLYVTRIDPRPK